MNMETAKLAETRVKAPTALICYAYVWHARANQDPTKEA